MVAIQATDNNGRPGKMTAAAKGRRET